MLKKDDQLQYTTTSVAKRQRPRYTFVSNCIIRFVLPTFINPRSRTDNPAKKLPSRFSLLSLTKMTPTGFAKILCHDWSTYGRGNVPTHRLGQASFANS